MATAVGMPRLGMTMEEGVVVEWLVSPGGLVERGAPLLVIESEKAEVEIEATTSGVLRHIFVEPGETVPCGTLLAVIADSADEPFDASAFQAANAGPKPAAKPPALETRAPSPASSADAVSARGSRKAVAPAARKLARDLGIDPASVPGSGPGGRVTRRDVAARAEARKALVDVGGGVALEVPSQGAGDALLLLPGFGSDVSVFARQIPVLAASHCVRGVNPRGVGLSDAPEQRVYSIAQSARDVAAVSPSPAHVVGASLGAAVAIELALSHPEKVRSLTLITPFHRAGGRLLAVAEAWADLAAAVEPELLAGALLPWLFSGTFLADESVRGRIRRGLAATLSRVPPATLPRVTAGIREWSGTRSAELDRISVPTLVLGAGEDLLTPEAESLAGEIPGARFVAIPRAGHAVGLEAPDEVNAAMVDSLSLL